MPTWLTVTSVIAAAVLLVGVGKWVGGVNADRKHLKQDAARDRKAFAETTKEIRRDIREILWRLPPVSVAGSTPLQLTDLGKAISEALSAREWAKTHAPNLNAHAGKPAYEIEEACFEYVEREDTFSDEELRAIRQSVYENGLRKRKQVTDVFAIELRDKLLET